MKSQLKQEDISQNISSSIFHDYISIKNGEAPISSLKNCAGYFHQQSQKEDFKEEFFERAHSTCTLPSLFETDDPSTSFDYRTRLLLKKLEHLKYKAKNHEIKEDETLSLLLTEYRDELQCLFNLIKQIQSRELEVLFQELENKIVEETTIEKELRENIEYVFRICRQFFAKWHSQTFFARIKTVNKLYETLVTSTTLFNFSETLCQMLGGARAVCWDDFNELYFLMTKGNNHSPLLEIMRSGKLLEHIEELQQEIQPLLKLLHDDPSIGEITIYNDSISLNDE